MIIGTRKFLAKCDMPDADNTDQRLTELEIKASFNEDLLDQLNQVIVRQQQQIDALIYELACLRRLAPAEVTGVPRNPRDDMPPHY
jgi:SlyX protein